MGCTRVEERMAAAFGELEEARVEFSFTLDVRFGGVLFALPALLINGLLRHSDKHFSLPRGFLRFKLYLYPDCLYGADSD